MLLDSLSLQNKPTLYSPFLSYYIYDITLNSFVPSTQASPCHIITNKLLLASILGNNYFPSVQFIKTLTVQTITFPAKLLNTSKKSNNIDILFTAVFV